MTKVKLILGGVAGAVGLTGAALVPSLMNSDKKLNSGGKAVAKSWAKGTNKDTKFKSFGDAFAPFLVDLDRTDDEFWKARSEQTKSIDFDSGKTFSGWSNITDEKQRISRIKEGCRSFQSSSLRNSDITDVGKMMKLCGIYGSKEQSPGFVSRTEAGLTQLNEWTAEQVCKMLVDNSITVKEECGKIEVVSSSSASA